MGSQTLPHPSTHTKKTTGELRVVEHCEDKKHPNGEDEFRPDVHAVDLGRAALDLVAEVLINPQVRKQTFRACRSSCRNDCCK